MGKHYNCLATLFKEFPTFFPIVDDAATMATATREAMRAYSMEVAPDSSARNLEARFFMGGTPIKKTGQIFMFETQPNL
jgi:hypothetical protein